LISLFIGFKFSLISSFLISLFSFCLALFNDAKLLPFVSISSPLKALEIVNFNSLFFEPSFPLWVGSPFSLFVALCSASFLFSKSLDLDGFTNVSFLNLN